MLAGEGSILDEGLTDAVAPLTSPIGKMIGFEVAIPTTYYDGSNLEQSGYIQSDSNALITNTSALRNNEVMIVRIPEIHAKSHGMVNQNDASRYSDNVLSFPVPKSFGGVDIDGVIFYDPPAPVYYALHNKQELRLTQLSAQILNLDTNKEAIDLEGNSVISLHIKKRS